MQSPDRYCAISSFRGARLIRPLIASPKKARAISRKAWSLVVCSQKMCPVGQISSRLPTGRKPAGGETLRFWYIFQQSSKWGLVDSTTPKDEVQSWQSKDRNSLEFLLWCEERSMNRLYVLNRPFERFSGFWLNRASVASPRSGHTRRQSLTVETASGSLESRSNRPKQVLSFNWFLVFHGHYTSHWDSKKVSFPKINHNMRINII